MNSIPELAKKTSINSLLNPEASSGAFNSQIPNLTASLGGHQVQPHAHSVDVYAPPFATTPSFNLRAASWGGPEDRRKQENGQRQYGHPGVDLYPDHATPRMVRERSDPGGYALHPSMWPTQQDVGYGASVISPMYSDERTALSGDYAHRQNTPVSSQLPSFTHSLTMLDHYTQGYPEQSSSNGTNQSWQIAERASTRIAARETAEENRYSAGSYYQPTSGIPHAQFTQEPPQLPIPRVVQPPPPSKRRSPDDEAPPPKAKRPKAASTAKLSTGPSKRGYPAKKRSEAAQIAAQNAKLMKPMAYNPNGKSKERALDGVSMQIVPSGPGDKSLQPELQNTRCMSTKYKSDEFPRCVACTRRWAGDTCRFQGIRYFLRNEQLQIVGVSFSEAQTADLPSLKFPHEWNENLTPEDISRTKFTIAKALLPTLRKELKHLRTPRIIHRPREREVRATCDTCMTSIFSSSWLCRLCGREACAECFATVCDLTVSPDADRKEQEAILARREKHGHSNPFFLQCTKRIEHTAREFSPMSRFCERELDNAIKEMEVVVQGGDQAPANGVIPSSSSASPLEQTAPGSGGLPSTSFNNSSDYRPTSSLTSLINPVTSPEYTTSNPFVPPNLSPTTLSVPTLAIRRYKSGALTKESFPGVWALGEPLVVEGLLDRLKISWTPEYFMEKYGGQGCLIIECQTEMNKRITVGEFFREFGMYEGRTQCWKLKDWPPSMDFQKAFPELYEDFSNAVPVPSYVRRDGVLNLASHFPSDTISPDIGPKMYNAMATTQAPGSKGSTRLHMDMADAVNIMTYASACRDGTPGCAAWDLFRADDSNKIRQFLMEHARTLAQAKAKEKENGAAGTAEGKRVAVVVQDWTTNDPIHGQQFYLDEEMRAKLFDETGVRSFRFYQRPGEAVFIPAGCAHQVANLADCVKVAVDFVSPENIERCEKLTKEFREQNQRKVWKEDVLQLRTMMWFAWLSCRQQEGFELESEEDSQ